MKNSRFNLRDGNDERTSDSLFEEDQPQNADNLGRPAWWFKGSLFTPKNAQDKKLARLQYVSIVKDELILTERAQRIRQFISVLSEWFPINVLDSIGKEILIETNIRQNDDQLVFHFLGALEADLRKRNSTIRWNVLEEISKMIGYSIKKSDYTKWMFYTRQRRKESGTDTMKLVQRLVIEDIARKNISPKEKREFIKNTVQSCNKLKKTGFICKDPEVAAWSLKRVVINEKGAQKDVPQELRSAVTRMNFRIRKSL
jgi:hypothetical protein